MKKSYYVRNQYQRRNRIKRANESAFLGLFEGKRKLAKAEAKQKELEAEAAKLKTESAAKIAELEAETEKLKAEAEAAASGYESDATVRAATVEAADNKNLYMIIAGIVAVVMIALVFIKRKK